MRNGNGSERVVLDGYTRLCLTLISGLLVALVLGLWADRPPAPAWAQTEYKPFVNADQATILAKAQQQTNEELVELRKLLESGRVKVQVVSAPGPSAGGANVPTSQESGG